MFFIGLLSLPLIFSFLSPFKIQAGCVGINYNGLTIFSTPDNNSVNNASPLTFWAFSSSPSSSLSPLGAEVRPGGHSVSAPAEAAGALGHRWDLPHTPWKVWVCVSLSAPSLRHRDWHMYCIWNCWTSFSFYLFCNGLHIQYKQRRNTCSKEESINNLTHDPQLVSCIMAHVLASKPNTFLCTQDKLVNP